MPVTAFAHAADLLDPPKRDVFQILGYTPSEKQAEFHQADEFDVGYGGAAGGGKTKALLLDGIQKADHHPGLRAGAFRRTYDELAESFLKELALIGFAEDLGCRWNGTERELKFPNGSVIRFRYLETVQDATRRQGGEYQMVLLDEATLIPPAAVSILVDERIRTGSTAIPIIGVRSGTNPGGPGHTHWKTRYVDATNHGQTTYTDDHGRTVRFIPARVADNPHLEAADPGYIRRLDAIADPARRAAMRDGSWDSFAGQVFAEWRHDRHVIRPFTIPDTWQRNVGIDYGFRAPWSALWGALDGDGRLWIYRQLYATGVGEKEQARRILDAEGALTPDGRLALSKTETVYRRAADPSMWSKVGDANPLADTYRAEGCHVTKATNDRIAGVQRVHSYLAEGPACPHHRALGWETCPMLHVFDTCPDLIRTLPGLPSDPKKPEDVDTDAEDHAYDSLRYLVMELPLPRTTRERATAPATTDERFWDARQKRAKTQARRKAAGRIG